MMKFISINTPIIVDFVDRNFRYKSLAFQIADYAGQLTTPSTAQKVHSH